MLNGRGGGEEPSYVNGKQHTNMNGIVEWVGAVLKITGIVHQDMDTLLPSFNCYLRSSLIGNRRQS